MTAAEQVLRERVRERLVGTPVDAPPAEVRLSVRAALHRVLDEERMVLPAARLGALARELADDIAGLGPLEPLLRDPAVTEVMVNGPGEVWVERAGRLEVSGVVLSSGEEIVRLVQRAVGPLGLRVDEAQPYVEARLPDGSRLHAVIPPVAVSGPAVTIRRFARRPFTLADLVTNRTMSPHAAAFLELCVRARLNVVVTGGSGSGKTTLLRVLCGCVPPGERIVTIEEAAELRLVRPQVVALEARPPNVEGAGEVTVRALLRNALRMRPDRIVVGEVRGGEALDMLQAMNTGHDGSLSTCHCNAPADLLGRLETMVLQGGVPLDGTAIRRQIAAAVDIVVHAARLPDGGRRLVHICDVRGLEEGALILGDVFRLDRVTGAFVTGPAPACLTRIADAGLPAGWPPVWPAAADGQAAPEVPVQQSSAGGAVAP